MGCVGNLIHALIRHAISRHQWMTAFGFHSFHDKGTKQRVLFVSSVCLLAEGWGYCYGWLCVSPSVSFYPGLSFPHSAALSNSRAILIAHHRPRHTAMAPRSWQVWLSL